MPHDKELTVSNTLARLNEFNKIYISNNTFPDFKSSFDINLFNTFRSYLNLEKHFPKPHQKILMREDSLLKLLELKLRVNFHIQSLIVVLQEEIIFIQEK